MDRKITIDDFNANTKEWLIEELTNMSRSRALQTICDLHDDLYKSKCLTTYEDCCKELGYDTCEYDDYLYHGYKRELLETFIKLLICRDAYYKLYGKGSGKVQFVIATFEGEISLSVKEKHGNYILSFPTRKIMYMFYENFKELIEKCKELL